MRTCASCQKQIPDDARTCAFCGASVKPPAPPEAYETVAGLQPPEGKSQPETLTSFSGGGEESHSIAKTLLIAAIVVVVLGGAAAAGFFLLGGGEKPRETQSPQATASPLPGLPAPPPDAAGGPQAVSSPELAAFVGTWENEDALTRDKTRIEIIEEGGGLSVHMVERSTPGVKDMGTTVGFIDPATGTVALTWALPDKTEQQHLKFLQDGRLKLWGTVQFTRGSTRINREYDNYFTKTGPPPPTEEELKAAAEEEKAKAAKAKKGKRRR